MAGLKAGAGVSGMSLSPAGEKAPGAYPDAREGQGLPQPEGAAPEAGRSRWFFTWASPPGPLLRSRAETLVLLSFCLI